MSVFSHRRRSYGLDLEHPPRVKRVVPSVIQLGAGAGFSTVGPDERYPGHWGCAPEGRTQLCFLCLFPGSEADDFAMYVIGPKVTEPTHRRRDLSNYETE